MGGRRNKACVRLRGPGGKASNLDLLIIWKKSLPKEKKRIEDCDEKLCWKEETERPQHEKEESRITPRCYVKSR